MINKILLYSLILLLVLGNGCTQTTEQTKTITSSPKTSVIELSDNIFTPPTGAADGSGVETPGQRRLMTATSTDGINFTRTNTVVTDQASVPDFLMMPDGTLYLYYGGWTVGDRENVAAVAISYDQGTTWEHHQIDYAGDFPMEHSSDPDVVLLPDGTFRLYSTSNAPERHTIVIYLSTSIDGIHFETQGIAFEDDPQALDSNTFLVDDVWHMYTLSGQSMRSYHATSTDGITFTKQNLSSYKIDRYEMVMSNVLPFDDVYRMYTFSPASRDIRSFTSNDGTAWTPETGIRLAFDPTATLESEYVKDPAVIKLLDGSYLMVYVTQIP